MVSIVVLNTRDNDLIVRHITELPEGCIFRKPNGPRTDLERPFPVPFSTQLLEQCLLLSRSPQYVDTVETSETLMQLAEMLGFSNLVTVLGDVRAKKGKKAGARKKTTSVISHSVAQPHIFVDQYRSLWDPVTIEDTEMVIPLRYVSPTSNKMNITDKLTGIIDTIYLTKSGLDLPCTNVHDYVRKTAHIADQIVFEDFINWILKNTDNPAISKKEARELVGIIPKAIEIYKKYVPQFDPNNVFHLWSFWRDTFHGKWKNVFLGCFANLSLDLTIRLLSEIMFVDLTGWSGMRGGYDTIVPEDLLGMIISKEWGLPSSAKVVTQELKKIISKLNDKSNLVHNECLDVIHRTKTCEGCRMHLDYYAMHSAYMNDLRDITYFFFQS